jgi:imidazolonepropionase-like amidohydrolase
MLTGGAVAIGEVGAGHTLGGGGQDYHYIPLAVKRKTGRDISERQARGLKRAVLGRYVDPGVYNDLAVAEALQAAGLHDCLTPAQARDLIVSTVMPPVNAALEGLREAAALAQKYTMPVIVHNSAPSKLVVTEIAETGLGSRLIAAHSNHTTFELEEGLRHAGRLRERGTTIDLSTYGSFKEGDTGEMEMQFALLGNGLVDTVSTDYGGGTHDPMLLVLEMATERGLLGLAEAVALVTGNVAKAIPELASNRGLIARGREADLVITGSKSISDVDMVLIAGQLVVQGGQRVPLERG